MLLSALQALLDRYFQLQPGYQGVPLAQLRFKRVLFGGFPCYSDGPLQPHFDRIIQARALQWPSSTPFRACDGQIVGRCPAQLVEPSFPVLVCSC